MEVVKELGPDVPVFGVCMGHQCIGQSFGGRIIRAPCGVMHGKTSDVYHTNTGLLEVRGHGIMHGDVGHCAKVANTVQR